MKLASGFWPALLIGGFLFFHQIGAAPLFDLDEAVYAETAREMLASGDWITPLYNDRPVYDKPALLYWLMAASFRLFGINEFAARLPSALFGTALLFVVHRLVREIRGERAALIALLVLATSLEMIVLAHAAMTDMPLVFFITLSLACYYRAQAGGGRAARAGIYLSAALAVLAKGPVGLLIPGAVIFLFELGGGLDRRRLRDLRPLQGLVLFAAVALPWYAAMIHLHGAAFIDSFFLRHNIQRFTSVLGGHAGAPFYYLAVIAAGFYPWSAFLPAAFVSVFTEGRAAARRGLRGLASERSFEWFLVLWISVVLIFFTLAGTKLPNYIAPAFPAMAVLTGLWWDRRWGETGYTHSRAERLSFVLLGFFSGVLASGLLSVPLGIERARVRFAEAAPFLVQSIHLNGPLAALAAILLVGAVSFFITYRLVRRSAGFMTLALAAGVFAFVMLGSLIPKAGEYVQAPLRDLAREAAQWVHPDEPFVVFGLKKPSLLFYARRGATVFKSDQAGPLREFLSGRERAAVIAPIHLVPELSVLPRLTFRSEKGGYVLATTF